MGPWRHISRAEVFSQVAQGKRPALSDPCKEELCKELAPTGWYALMHKCWAQTAADRPDFVSVHHTLSDISRGLDIPDAAEGVLEFEIDAEAPGKRGRGRPSI